MKSLRTMFPMLSVLAVLAGCSGAETGASNTAESANAIAATTEAGGDRRPAGPHAGRPHGGGPDFLVFAALHEDIGLSAGQRSTIEGLVAKDRAKAPPQPDKAKTAALASAIRAGKVDASSLRPAGDGGEAAMKERVAASAAKLATLHETLTAEQRAALVDAIAAKHAQRPEGPGGEGKHAHGPRPDGERGRGPMGDLLEGLDLTQAQKDSLESKLAAQRPTPPSEADRTAMKAKFESMKRAMDAKLQTFKTDAFDANAFVAPPADAPGRAPHGDHADMMAKHLSAVVSVLDEAQREKLAQKIEQGPPARPQRR